MSHGLGGADAAADRLLGGRKGETVILVIAIGPVYIDYDIGFIRIIAKLYFRLVINPVSITVSLICSSSKMIFLNICKSVIVQIAGGILRFIRVQTRGCFHIVRDSVSITVLELLTAHIRRRPVRTRNSIDINT